MTYKVLALSDVLLDLIYNAHIGKRFADIDIVIGCGDLPYYYLEFIISMLDVPLFFVRGNHAYPVEYTVGGPKTEPFGAIDLHTRVVRHDGLLLAGVEGSLRYRKGPYQYTQGAMWRNVLRLVPGLLLNRVIYGRFLDVFVTHAPPVGIHDQPDIPHQGIHAFRWLLNVFQPAYHFHGHVHVYRPDTVTKTEFNKTKVINTYGYTENVLEPAPRGYAPLGFLRRQGQVS